MIDAENLTKKFGEFTAVDDLTLHIEEGEVFGFLGPNGAGKTTTVRMLTGLISKTSGKAQIGSYEMEIYRYAEDPENDWFTTGECWSL